MTVCDYCKRESDECEKLTLEVWEPLWHVTHVNVCPECRQRNFVTGKQAREVLLRWEDA